MKKYDGCLIVILVFIAFIFTIAIIYWLAWLILDEYIIELWNSLLHFLNK